MQTTDLTQYFRAAGIAASLGGVAIYFAIRYMLNKAFAKILSSNPDMDQRRKSSLKLQFGFTRFLLGFIIILVILQNFGIQITSLLASLGITGAVAGLAMQDYLKDIVMGYNIIASHYFAAGEVVRYGDFEGEVVYSDLKMTKIRSIDDDSILSVSNRNLDKVIRVSDMFDIDIPMPYDEPYEHCRDTVRKIAFRAKDVKGVNSAALAGTQAFLDSAITYRLRMFIDPKDKGRIRREVNYIIQQELEEANIAIPFTQIDVHQK
jgi:small-conductance mechanosensitive channel